MSHDDVRVPVGCPLTPTQWRVLFLSAQGLETKQIAERLTVAPTTVRTHLHDACRALGVHTAAPAVVVMLREGWLHTDELATGWQGDPYTTSDQGRFNDNWQPTPAQRLYLDAFTRMTRDPSDVQACADADFYFVAMCRERGCPDRRSDAVPWP